MNFEERIVDVVKKNIEGKCEVTTESRLIEDLGVDSFSKIMIIAAIEDEFCIEINEATLADIEKVSDIIDKLRIEYPMIEGD